MSSVDRMISQHPEAEADCEVCAGTGVYLVAGIVPNRLVIERCDPCAVYAGDMEAALALSPPGAISEEGFVVTIPAKLLA